MKDIHSLKAKATNASAVAKTSDEFVAIMLLPRNLRQTALRAHYKTKKS